MLRTLNSVKNDYEILPWPYSNGPVADVGNAFDTGCKFLKPHGPAKCLVYGSLCWTVGLAKFLLYSLRPCKILGIWFTVLGL